MYVRSNRAIVNMGSDGAYQMTPNSLDSNKALAAKYHLSGTLACHMQFQRCSTANSQPLRLRTWYPLGRVTLSQIAYIDVVDNCRFEF